MVKSESESKEVVEKEITQAQMTLIGELYEETNSPRQYCPEALAQISRNKANKHIQFLKDLKSRQYQERKNHETGVQFDKIGFGMVYKIVWRAASETPLAVKMSQHEFEDRLCAEYKVFKDAQEACRQFVKDGGLK